MGGCQNYGPFLGPYYNTAPNIQGTQKGTIIFWQPAPKTQNPKPETQNPNVKPETQNPNPKLPRAPLMGARGSDRGPGRANASYRRQPVNEAHKPLTIEVLLVWPGGFGCTPQRSGGPRLADSRDQKATSGKTGSPAALPCPCWPALPCSALPCPAHCFFLKEAKDGRRIHASSAFTCFDRPEGGTDAPPRLPKALIAFSGSQGRPEGRVPRSSRSFNCF